VIWVTALAALSAPRLGAQALGSLAAERARLAEITGDTTSARAGRLDTASWRVRTILGTTLVAVGPSIRLVRNSGLPYSHNDGALWAGRGWSTSVAGGFTATRTLRGATLRVAVEPMGFYSQNLPFQVFPNRTPGRSGYANPFHGPEASLDLPHRFGDRPVLGFDFGNSGLSAEFARVAVGASTASEWWGPGIRNAIVMSNNAPGIPRFFVKTGHPLRSRIGALDAQIISGTLTSSRFFSVARSDFRTISGALLQLKPAFDSTLTLGLTRVVYTPVGQDELPTLAALSRSANAIVRWENIAPGQRSDQIGSLFARWIFPDAGFEVYGEWARMDPPRSVTELLTAAHYSGGWTFGFQWAQPRRNHSFLRLQSELTYLEQSIVFPDRPTPDFYSGRASPAGYTQRGQIVGAAIGPGSSSQFIAVDWLAPRWQWGAFVGRVRWDNDALYREPGTTFFHHDVSLMSGLRGGWRSRLSDFTAELTVARRMNYLFQNGSVSPPGFRTVDVSNVTLVLAATPR
jgi:hypothetical protein